MFHRLLPPCRVIGPLFVYFLASLPALGPSTVGVVAQEKDAKSKSEAAEVLSLERIFGAELTAESYSAEWAEGSDTFWRWQRLPDAGAGRHLVKIDARSGSQEVVVHATDLVPPGAETPLSVEQSTWSRNSAKLLIFTGSQRVWRHKTRGDYWVFDRTSRVLHQLGRDFPASSLMFAKFAPDGNSVAYVHEGNIYLESLLDHTIRPLTTGPTDDIINGTFDWVYEEELQVRDGFRWSENGEAIAFWQLDTSGVQKFTLVNNTDGFYPETIQFAYPKTGQRNSACRIGVYGLAEGTTTWLAIPGDPREHYLCRLEWDGPAHVLVQQLNRRQNTLRVFRCDVRTGAAEIVLQETDEAWVDVHDELFWLDNRQRMTWISERDGWRHVYLVDRDTQQFQRVTDGPHDVIQLLGADDSGGWLYYLASPDNATQQYLYRIQRDGSKCERVTPEDQAGWHTYDLSPSRKLAIHRWSRFGRPPRVELVELATHKKIRSLESNKKLQKKLELLERGREEFFQIDLGDGVRLDAWCIWPTHFDESQIYPVLVHVYGEPAGQTVLDRWLGANYLWHQMLAQRGYFVVSVDNRGTPAPGAETGANRFTVAWVSSRRKTRPAPLARFWPSAPIWTRREWASGVGVVAGRWR